MGGCWLKAQPVETAGNVAGVIKLLWREEPDEANPIPTKDAGIGKKSKGVKPALEKE